MAGEGLQRRPAERSRPESQPPLRWSLPQSASLVKVSSSSWRFHFILTFSDFDLSPGNITSLKWPTSRAAGAQWLHLLQRDWRPEGDGHHKVPDPRPQDSCHDQEHPQKVSGAVYNRWIFSSKVPKKWVVQFTIGEYLGQIQARWWTRITKPCAWNHVQYKKLALKNTLIEQDDQIAWHFLRPFEQ